MKQFRGTPADTARRLRRSLSFEQLVGAAAIEHFAAPRCLGWDEAAGLIVYELVESARSGADLVLDAAFDDDLAERAGLAIGELHALPVLPAPPASLIPPNAPIPPASPIPSVSPVPSASSILPDSLAAEVPDLDRSEPLLPSTALLTGLTPGIFAASSAAELQAWSLMQHDEALTEAIRHLLATQDAIWYRPAHCDLRIEQFFLADDRLYLCDWEEFRLADPARDVGSFAGEWLHQAVMTMAGDAGEEAQTFTRAEIGHRIADGISRLAPRISAFWTGYRKARPDADEGLAVRAAAFAGWHMFDRMLAVARRSPRLRAIDRAAAGIGRTILLAPQDAVPVIGLGG